MNAQQKLTFAKAQISALIKLIQTFSPDPSADPVDGLETLESLVAELVFWWEEKTKHENALAFWNRRNVMEYKPPFDIRHKSGWVAASGFYTFARALKWKQEFNPQLYTDKTLSVLDFIIFDVAGQVVPLQ